ncbi:MAG: DMT family transporter [Nitrosopumilus sp.]|nr:DMT family transporter [Nitrosopumilus sp.]MDH3823885.1 DMT family transporter [Nitrosopumilus sp.]MDH3833437.1 DMT family transporter [Nitrosopumilus sp.]
MQIRRSGYGYYLIILAAALSALLHVVSKPMLENSETTIEINPIVMAFLIYFICGIFFTPLVKNTHSISKFGRKDWIFIGLIGIAEVSALITYFYGLTTSTAVNASLFSNSEIIFALVIAMLVFRERLHIKECIPFTMIIIGMMIVPIGNDLYQNNFALHQLVTGDLLIILAGFLYAVDITLCKYLGDRFDVKKITQIVSFICAAVAISLIVVFQIPMDVDLMQLPGIFILSILGTGMSTLFFLMGMKIIGAVRTVLLYSTTSVFGVVFSGLILAETVTVADICSLALVLTGIFFLRNRLVEGNESINTDEKLIKSTNTSRKNKSSKKRRHMQKTSIMHIIEKNIVFQSWAGAG